MSVDIDTLLAVPDDVDVAIKDWVEAKAALLNTLEGTDVERAAIYRQRERRIAIAWQRIGKAVEEHVAEKVNEALRLERGGCQYCPAAHGEAHSLDCGRPRKE
jgi:hypothetical protein